MYNQHRSPSESTTDDEIVYYAHENAADALLHRLRERLHTIETSKGQRPTCAPATPVTQLASATRRSNANAAAPQHAPQSDDFDDFFTDVKKKDATMPEQNQFEAVPVVDFLPELKAAVGGAAPHNPKRKKVTNSLVVVPQAPAWDEICDDSSDDGRHPHGRGYTSRIQQKEVSGLHHPLYDAEPCGRPAKQNDMERNIDSLFTKLNATDPPPTTSTSKNAKRSRGAQMTKDAQITAAANNNRKPQPFSNVVITERATRLVESLLDATSFPQFPKTNNHNNGGLGLSPYQGSSSTTGNITSFSAMLNAVHIGGCSTNRETTLTVALIRCVRNVIRCTRQDNGSVVDVVCPNAWFMSNKGLSLEAGVIVVLRGPMWNMLAPSKGQIGIIVASAMSVGGGATTLTRIALTQFNQVSEIDLQRGDGQGLALKHNTKNKHDDGGDSFETEEGDEWRVLAEDIVAAEAMSM
eukprot:PhF_6_TR6320/c0_g1_i1/m.9577